MDSSREHRLPGEGVARPIPHPICGSNIGKKHLTRVGFALVLTHVLKNMRCVLWSHS